MKALFVQIEEKKSGVKVTAWEQDFSYSESCNNVYTTKSVYRNGSKSTLPAFAKASGRAVEDIPYILTANTYFWNPSSSPSGRRRNERIRGAEMAAFMIDNEVEATRELNEMFAQHLEKGESIQVDTLGAFLRYKGHDYHFSGMITKKNIQEVRDAIRDRRVKDIKAYRLQKLQKEERLSLLGKTFVTVQDSINSGNCKAGTINFYQNIPLVKKGFRIRALRADALLKLRNDVYTNRAVNAAMQRTI